MVLTEATGVLLLLVGGYALARPMAIRNFPTADQWETDPEKARKEQRAFATLVAFGSILGGIVLIALGLLGLGP